MLEGCITKRVGKICHISTTFLPLFTICFLPYHFLSFIENKFGLWIVHKNLATKISIRTQKSPLPARDPCRSRGSDIFLLCSLLSKQSNFPAKINFEVGFLKSYQFLMQIFKIVNSPLSQQKTICSLKSYQPFLLCSLLTCLF